MKLLELCEPLFQYICRLNRSSRKGGMHDYARVRAEIEAIFKEIKAKASTSADLAVHYEKVELPLIFFVDSIIAESPLAFAQVWHNNRLAYDRKELAGDDEFFRLLDETVADKSEAGAERLAVFYTCLGLGFAGAYADQPQFIRQKMLQCSARMRGMMDADDQSRICPEAYEHLDTRNLVEPPGTKLLGIGIALVGLIIVLFIANIVLFSSTAKELTRKLDRVRANAAATDAAVSRDSGK
ncbi:MAG TPA: DotU family type IV/VI secretion system protein [Planctomycetota bacterium]|nr:DotU family type IV/VI secretion system protein [Planctomycetota bacterium]HUW33826.1 DotU family type IV/VI secretion system protein [Planctomycetota bacterium]